MACCTEVRMASPDSGLEYVGGSPQNTFKYSMRGNRDSYVGSHSIQVFWTANIKEMSLGWGVVHTLEWLARIAA